MRRRKKLGNMIREQYLQKLDETHDNVLVAESGLFIPPEVLFIGATPDGFVNCDCCGRGIIEMKAPQNQNLDENFIPMKHLFQIQLFCVGLVKAKYCDYIAFHPNGTTIKRVFPDVRLQEFIIDKDEVFFRRVIISELLSRYFSSLRSLHTNSGTSDEDDENLYCFCQKPWEDPMVRCVGEDCTLEWFHARCFHLKTVPKRMWYCIECKQRQ
ncbi:hypothetical protein ONE63_011543 [Megalurothrips usitatus]|uniref:PHD-type domain-containing protein n=1 Tax=Megalurothrips usitatus TaxID=439358 RepID=A0AAV7X257_9NEOP|nr:hypothetical protein ONE63_011543 [Megalurothrips usitatus]